MELSIKTNCAVKTGYDLWYSNNSFNGLFRTDIRSLKTEFVGFFPNEAIDKKHMHIQCVISGSKIIFVPWKSSYIHIYDLETDRFDAVKIADEEESVEPVFAGAVEIGDHLYMFPAVWSGDLYDYDIGLNTVRKIESFRMDCMKMIRNNKANLLISASLYEGGIYFALYNSDIIGRYDPDSGKVSFVSTGIEGLSTLSVSGNRIFVNRIPDDSIYEYDITGKRLIPFETDNEVKEGKKTKEGKRSPFYRTIQWKEDILSLPWHGEKIYRLKKKTWEIILDCSRCQMGEDEGFPCFVGYIAVDDRLWLLPNRADRVLICDSSFSNVQEVELTMSNDSDKERLEKLLAFAQIRGQVINENEILTLDGYLKHLTFCSDDRLR